jgi:Glycosyl transferases group 1
VTLGHAELYMASVSDAIVLVSPHERDLLARQLSPETAQRTFALSPPAVIRRRARPATDYRFVFVGSDAYQPNRIAIDFLLGQWHSLRPTTSLHIYGRQGRVPIAVPGVHWHGFVDDIAEAYAPGSIALTPLPLPGGIKTKVVEAWTFGCPVLGTPASFEGLCGPEYPLAIELPDWPSYLATPHSKSALWGTAAEMGQTIIRERLSPERYRAAWISLLSPLPNRKIPDTIVRIESNQPDPRSQSVR